MTVKVNDNIIQVSREVEALPIEFVDFAIKHRSSNGGYYWNHTGKNTSARERYRLEDIKLIARHWGPNTYAISLKFVFTCPRVHCIVGNLTDEEKLAACYKHDLVDYDSYYVNLVEGPDIYPMILELDLTLPFDINGLLIEYY